jgi:MFS family permease
MNSPILGLKENWKQFTLLIIINAFVGGMVGLERSILPQIAEVEFHMAAKTAILSFIIVFGIVKAITNYFTGTLANKVGRRNLLIIGWFVGIPIPFILMYAPDWHWVIFANILLGINQGLAWSSTVVMKIDLVGEKNRGLAMGLNEFAGYVAVAAVGFITAYTASRFGLRPYPFYIGIVLSVSGLFFSLFLLRDTVLYSKVESASSSIPKLTNIFLQTTWIHKNLGAVTQAGFVNNLNDGMVWGLFPILLFQKGFSITQIGIITSLYPAFWGIGQLITGKMADHISNKKMLFVGMLLQGIVLTFMLYSSTYIELIIIASLLGIGTAIVYPTFLVSIANNTHPEDRAKSLGTFRFWRDLGYAFGALLTGIIADSYGLNAPVLAIGGLTILSSMVILIRMKNKE